MMSDKDFIINNYIDFLNDIRQSTDETPKMTAEQLVVEANKCFTEIRNLHTKPPYYESRSNKIAYFDVLFLHENRIMTLMKDAFELNDIHTARIMFDELTELKVKTTKLYKELIGE